MKCFGKISSVVLLACLFSGVIFSCDIQDQWSFESSLPSERMVHDNSFAFTEDEKNNLEGIYKVVSGNEFIGDTLVFKVIRNKLSVFASKDGFYSILGVKRDSLNLIFEGEWRYALNEKKGKVEMKSNYNRLMGEEHKLRSNIDFYGKYELDNISEDFDFQLIKIEDFTDNLKNDNFLITAHRGGGRTADKLAYSENSIEMIGFSEYLGSNSIEIDVQLTKDNIPVLYHDKDLNIRLVQKGPLNGYIRDYNINELKSFVKLIHGEQIPTLEEALGFVINYTGINLVLLDIKNGESIDYVVPVQTKYSEIASKKGRDLQILVSIQSEEVYSSFKALNEYKNIPACCTMEISKVNEINAFLWNYRWTQGILEQELIDIHSLGRKCMVWTLDVPEFIDLYVSHGNNDPMKRFDGILTNYPTILSYYHYVRHNK
jgi:glycerophosphoryl diester phosphodiesterase